MRKVQIIAEIFKGSADIKRGFLWLLNGTQPSNSCKLLQSWALACPSPLLTSRNTGEEGFGMPLTLLLFV